MTEYVETVTEAPDDLIAGDLKLVTDEIVIASGQVLTRRTVLGRVTASDKFVISLAGASDGSEVPRAILAEDVDATAGDKRGPAYRTGEFNEDALILGAGHTADSIRDGLRGLGIHLKKVVG